MCYTCDSFCTRFCLFKEIFPSIPYAVFAIESVEMNRDCVTSTASGAGRRFMKDVKKKLSKNVI